MVPRRTLLRNVELAAWLFIVNMLASCGAGFFLIEPSAGSAWPWLGPLMVAMLAFSLSALFVRLWGTVQHIEINPRRIKRYRSIGQRRYREFECSLAGRIEVVAGDSVGTVSENRFYVRLRDAETRASLANLIIPTRREAEWVATLLRRAADPEASDETPRCCGCGAPFLVAVGAQAAGSVSCSFCGAGFVVGLRELHWAPLVLPWPEDSGPKAGAVRASKTSQEMSKNVRRKRGRGPNRSARSWEILPTRLVGRILAAVGLSSSAVFFLGFGSVTVWLAGEAPGLSLFMLLSSAMMFGIAVYSVLLILLQLFGREEIGMDEATFWMLSRVGNFDLRRFVRVPANQGWGLRPVRWRPAAARVPLLRLTGVEIWREQGSTRLRLTTPTRQIETAWQLPLAEDRQLRREVVELLAERVRALGREVELESGAGRMSRRTHPFYC